MADSKVVEQWECFGTPVYLGEECRACKASHFCDAVCFRFAPRVFLCPGCRGYSKHGEMKTLIQQYRLRRALTPEA